MAGQKKESLIALELENLDAKVIQFQDYMTKYDIRFIDEDKRRHDEVDCQIKIMNALPNWLAALEKLRNQNGGKKIEVRADAEISGLMKLKENQ